MNRVLVLRTGVWVLLVWALIVLLGGMYWLVRGYAVDPLWYAWTALGSVLVWTGWVIWKRVDEESAARTGDRFYGLKDALITAWHFRQKGREDAVASLQALATMEQLRDIDVRRYPVGVSKKLCLSALVLAFAAGGISMVPPSDEVRERLAQEDETLKRTSEAKEEMLKMVEELAAELDEEEEELLNPDELRKWVDDFGPTKDQQEAMRQFARLEQKINENLVALEKREEDALAKQAAKELKKADEGEARKMGEKLDKKDYEEAAEMLEKMKRERMEKLAKEGKLDEKAKREKLDENRKEVARMRAMSRRMKAAAERMKRGREGNQGNGKGAGEGAGNDAGAGQQGLAQNGEGEFGEQGKMAEGMLGEMAEDGDLGGIMEEWDDELAEMEEWLDEMEEGLEEWDGEEAECMGRCRGRMDDLAKRFRRMGAREKALDKMRRMRRMMGRAQGYAQGLSNSMTPGASPGGKKPGWGSSDAKRDERDQLADNGQFSRLQGQKNAGGPSLSKIEDADSGSGVSGRRGVARQRDYEKQFESFVERDDIPDEVKNGVKEYFLQLNAGGQTEEE